MKIIKSKRSVPGSSKLQKSKFTIKASREYYDYDRDERIKLASDVLNRSSYGMKSGAFAAYRLSAGYTLTFNYQSESMQSNDLIFTIWNPNPSDEYDYAGIIYTDLKSAEAGNDESEVYYNMNMRIYSKFQTFKCFDDALTSILTKAQSSDSSIEESTSINKKQFTVKASRMDATEPSFAVFYAKVIIDENFKPGYEDENFIRQIEDMLSSGAFEKSAKWFDESFDAGEYFDELRDKLVIPKMVSGKLTAKIPVFIMYDENSKCWEIVDFGTVSTTDSKAAVQTLSVKSSTSVVVLPAGETSDDGRHVKANSCTSAKNIYAEDGYSDEDNARYEREQFAERIINEIEDEYSIKISDAAWGSIHDLAYDLQFGADAHKHGTDPMWVLEDTIYDIIEEDTGVVIGASKVSRNVVTAAQADTTVSQEDVDELVLYITNDGDLCRGRASFIIKNLKRKVKNGNYDKELAVKGWQPLADEGVRKYDREFGSGKGSVSMFNKATRTAIAEELRDYYEEDVFKDTVESSTVTADVDTNRNSPRRYNTTNENDLDYITALADGVATKMTADYGDIIELTYDISDTAITFSVDSEVIFIQPIDQIIPNWDDIDMDLEELYGSVWSAVIPKF